MATEIAQAFVRVRPNMSGFKSETEEGVKSGFSNVAKIVGLALGAAEAFKFGKDIVLGAASLQKSVEAIRSEFGAAGNAVVKFGEQGANSLGISAQTLDQTSAKFGTLFKNMGIGVGLSATMTKGFETLAGSLASIHHLNPAEVFQNLTLAAAGNPRVLRSLGIAIDQTQIKTVGQALGFTKAGQALTTAQKAVVIYTIATQHLAQIQAQAKQHSGDLANQMARLSAEWSNAKDKLGAALLPALAKVTTVLANKLPGAITRGTADFKKFVNILKEVTGPIGGIKGAMEGLLAAFAVSKIIAFAGAIKNDLVASGFRQLRIATEEEKAAYLESFGTMEIATIGLSATIKAALISTGIGALVVAVGIATGYVITHWEKVKRITIEVAHGIEGTWKGLKEFLIGTAKIIGGMMATYMTAPLFALLKVASFVGSIFDKVFGTHISSGLKKATDFISKFSTGLVKGGLKEAAQGGRDMASGFVHGFTGKMNDLSAEMSDSIALSVIKAAHGKALTEAAQAGVDAATKSSADLNKSLDNLKKTTAAGISSAQASITNLQQSLAQAIIQEGKDVADAVTQAKQNLQSVMSTISGDIGQIIDAPLNALSNKLSLGANKLSLENLRRSTLLPGGKQLSDDPKKAMAELKQLLRSTGPGNKAAVQGFILQYEQAHLAVQQSQATITKQSIEQSLAGLADAYSAGKITLKTFKEKVRAELKKDGVSYKAAGAVLGTAFASGFHGAVQGLFEQAAALKGFQGGKTGAGTVPTITKPLDVLHKDQLDIQKQQRELGAKQHALAVRQAKAAEKAAGLLAQIAAADKIIKSSLQSNPGLQSKIEKGLTGTKG